MWEGQKANGEVYRDRKATILYSINYCTARVSINFITQIHLMPAERRVYLESLDFVFSVERGPLKADHLYISIYRVAEFSAADT